MAYLVHLGILCMVFTIAAWSLNILVTGFGIYSAGHAAFMGIGAYGYALAQRSFGLPWPICLLLGSAASLVVGFWISRPTARLKPDQALLFTIAFQGAIATVLLNSRGLTGGAFGLSGIESASLPFMGPALFSEFCAVALMILVSVSVLRALSQSRVWLVVRAVGEDAVLAESLGVPSDSIRAVAISLSAAVAGAAGGLLAGYLTFIAPTSFGLDESVLLLTAVLVGGARPFLGPAVGVGIMILLPEALRQVSFSSTAAGSIQRVLFGFGLLLFARFRMVDLPHIRGDR